MLKVWKKIFTVLSKLPDNGIEHSQVSVGETLHTIVSSTHTNFHTSAACEQPHLVCPMEVKLLWCVFPKTMVRNLTPNREEVMRS